MSNPVKSESPIRVLLVDDHQLFRQGVRAVLNQAQEIVVIGEAENGQAAIDFCAADCPDVVLMDINMPVCSGLEATRVIKQRYPDVKILILTVSGAEESLFDAVKSGASGYVLKNARPADVMESIQRVFAGEPVIPSDLAMHIITEFSTPKAVAPERPQVDALTERELEVLRKLSGGATNREIAQALFISENTVRNHVRNILEKLHLNNRVQAAAYALREGFTDHPEEK
ncbi:MAG: response regulator transcription factor [Alicyclobacillus sp.]|nr:response regulator transcription factor [Alicyclobacillus sp.]